MAKYIEYQMSGSAVPAWLTQILPQFFLSRPAFTEACWAALISLRNMGTTLFVTLYVAADSSGQGGELFFPWLWSHGSGALIGLIFTALRATQAAQKAAKGTP